jgi:hypothetical protein
MNDAQLLDQIATHLESAAQLLRRLAKAEPQSAGTADATVGQNLSASEWIALARDLHPALGDRQEQVLLEVAKVHPEGTGTGPIWKAIDYEQTNTYLTLNSLARHGLVRKDDSSKPHHYYLGQRLLERAGSV